MAFTDPRTSCMLFFCKCLQRTEMLNIETNIQVTVCVKKICVCLQVGVHTRASYQDTLSLFQI